MIHVLSFRWTILAVLLTIGGTLGMSAKNYPLPKYPRITLALSGGGARGFAHIGVLKALEDAKIPIDGIAGTSIGAIVGGLYASGYSAVMLDSLLREIDWNDITQNPNERVRSNEFLDDKIEEDRGLISFRWTQGALRLPEGISRGIKLSAVLNKLIWNAPIHAQKSFLQLKVPFHAVATDIVTGKLVVFREGDLAFALRASANVPLRFTPLQKDSLRLVDGGVLSNLPVSTARSMNADIVIAVDISSPLLSAEELMSPWNIADQIMTSAMRRRTEEERRSADILILPDIGNHNASDFSNFTKLIKAGYQAGVVAIPRILEVIERLHAQKDIALTENGVSIARAIRYEGISASLQSAMRSRSHMMLPTVCTQDSVSLLISRIHAIFRELGYAMAHVQSWQLIQDTLILRCDDGLIRDVRITGNSVVSNERLMENLSIQPGRYFFTEEVLKNTNTLLTSGLYNDIQVYPHYVDTSGVVVDVVVRERGSRYLRLGTRLDNERNAQIGIDIGDERVWGSDVRASLRFAGGLRNQLWSAKLSVPSLFQSGWGWNLTGYAQRWNFYQYEQRPVDIDTYSLNRYNERQIERLGLRGSIQRQIERAGYLSVGMRLEEQRVSDVNRITVPSFRTINTIQFAARFDTQDRSDFPSGGRIINLSLEVPVASQKPNSFSKAIADITSIGRFGAHSFRPRLMFGFADATLPEAEWFSLGGEDIFYGKREDEMRGRQLALAQLEYQVRLPWDIVFDTYFSARYDIGSTWESPNNIRISDLHHGFGIALRWDTPLGPAGLSLGQSFYFASSPNRIINGPLLAYFSIGFRL